tara:strand:- start:2113 stop:2628 length:516 start_codon:yes stop_codon:yes gene_type:complete
MIETKSIRSVTPELIAFIEECTRLGFKNNNSLETMNFHKNLNNGGSWFITTVNNVIVGLSGVESFRDGFRALYRGCQLYSRPGGLSKNHMNCWMFYYHLPIVIDCAGDSPVYITTNVENDASGYMVRLNKLYGILAKRCLVDHVEDTTLNGVRQNIWRLNKETYTMVRNKQ